MSRELTKDLNRRSACHNAVLAIVVVPVAGELL